MSSRARVTLITLDRKLFLRMLQTHWLDIFAVSNHFSIPLDFSIETLDFISCTCFRKKVSTSQWIGALRDSLSLGDQDHSLLLPEGGYITKKIGRRQLALSYWRRYVSILQTSSSPYACQLTRSDDLHIWASQGEAMVVLG